MIPDLQVSVYIHTLGFITHTHSFIQQILTKHVHVPVTFWELLGYSREQNVKKQKNFCPNGFHLQVGRDKKKKESVYVRQDKCYGGKKTCIDSEHR